MLNKRSSEDRQSRSSVGDGLRATEFTSEGMYRTGRINTFGSARRSVARDEVFFSLFR